MPDVRIRSLGTPDSPSSSVKALLLATTAVFLTQLLLSWPLLNRWALWPDAVEYLLIGNSWANGTGFVVPTQWFFIPGAGQVLPAFAVRAPLVPFIIGLGFWAGATVLTIIQYHAVWSAAVVGLLVLGGARLVRLPTAIAVALWIGMFPAWRVLSRMPLTESTAVAMMIGVLLTLRSASRSIGGAVLCAGLSLVGWLTRPNLAGMALAVFVALCVTAEPRPTLRHRPAWAYAITFLVGFGLIRELTIAWTGWAPYSGYAILALFVEPGAFGDYAATPPTSMSALLFDNPRGVLGAAMRNLNRLVHELFATPRFSWVGWIGSAGVLWCLWGGLRDRLERRFLALCALGFGLGVVLTLGYWDANRYPLLSAVSGALCAAALVDDLCALLARQFASRPARRAMGALPLVAALASVWLFAPPAQRIYAHLGWPLRNLQGVKPHPIPRDTATKQLCLDIPPNVLVAAPNAWGISLWCGNPTIKLPRDFRKRAVRDRFLRERRPELVIEYADRRLRRGRRAIRLVPIRSTKFFNLLDVIGVDSVPEWRAPPPAACAGLPPSCLEAVGRSRDLAELPLDR